MAREPESAAFEPVRVAGGSRRSSAIVAGWLLGLAAIIAIAALHDAARGETAARGTGNASPPAVVEARPTADPGPPIALLEIAEARTVDLRAGTVARRLEISGQLLVRADRVRITLEGREDRILATIVRQAVRPPPRDTATVDRTFVATFELPAWRSGGMWVTVTAFDVHGDRIGRVRERIEVYPLPGDGSATEAGGAWSG